MAISLREVASRAGVSHSTASKVLNDRTSARIAVKTQQRVRQAAVDLGYSPNAVARSLARRRTDTIGLMLSDLRNPFFQEVFEKIETRVIDAGYRILLDAKITSYGQYHELRNLSSWLVDGVLIWTIPYHDIVEYLGERARNIPTVYLGHLREDGSDAVAMDLYGAGKQATEYVLERGYRRLCFISLYPVKEHERPINQIVGLQNNQVLAFQDVCRNAGVTPEILDLNNARNTQAASFQIGLEIAKRQREDRPDVLICHNDLVAHFVYLGLLQGGVRVPDDIGLVGFDGIEEGAYLPNGPLTTVRMPIAPLCETALNILLARMAGDTATPPQQILIPTELVVGGTA